MQLRSGCSTLLLINTSVEVQTKSRKRIRLKKVVSNLSTHAEALTQHLQTLTTR